jgi:hypothetical protein
MYNSDIEIPLNRAIKINTNDTDTYYHMGIGEVHSTEDHPAKPISEGGGGGGSVCSGRKMTKPNIT